MERQSGPFYVPCPLPDPDHFAANVFTASDYYQLYPDFNYQGTGRIRQNYLSSISEIYFFKLEKFHQRFPFIKECADVPKLK